MVQFKKSKKGSTNSSLGYYMDIFKVSECNFKVYTIADQVIMIEDLLPLMLCLTRVQNDVY